MRAAIYARKSQSQADVDERERSTTHQRAQCVALIARQGWTLAEGHEYIDEATSGAVFNRPGLLRLMDAVKSNARPFDVLVAYDEQRLGRDVIEGGYLAKQIIDSGVRIFFSDGTERKLESATDALLMAISQTSGASSSASAPASASATRPSRKPGPGTRRAPGHSGTTRSR